MKEQVLPEVIAPKDTFEAMVAALDDQHALSILESDTRGLGELDSFWRASDSWQAFSEEILALWSSYEYVIIRGLPVEASGASLLLSSTLFSGRYKRYRGSRIVKTFRMSPWTKDLSHTIREGDFHTDLNTSDNPPAVTCIQCLTPDPGAPTFGANRVARLEDLLADLRIRERNSTLRLMHEASVEMLNDHSGTTRRGSLVEGSRIQYHPETIRAAFRRGQAVGELDELIEDIKESAMTVSRPFWLEAGDAFFVSNYRALHYRGECSVVFSHYPLEYRARAIHVLHKIDEPSPWPTQGPH